MSFLPLHRDKEHKFKNGHWRWDEGERKLKFHTHESIDKSDKKTKEDFSVDLGLKFKKCVTEIEEKIFREKFLRQDPLYDRDIVTLQDIKNLVIFTVQTKLTHDFIELVHLETFDKFLYGIIFYMDFFLLVLEFLLIRRDEELKGKLRDDFSIKVEKFLSHQLSDRRLLVAKEYSKILYGHKSYINSLKNFRSQLSPLMSELLITPAPNDEILRIGEEKYLGCNEYLFNLELEYLVPECHLVLICKTRGIFGHPKFLYDTMLNLNEHELKKTGWDEDNDPYSLIKRVYIKIQTEEEFTKIKRFDL
ncbi:CLUMA_CG007414, isoform A [Clunio marinus]|uniref:CLUMA_CG007414, isoform A n=1 Tax=Clunio marinus TaxID=568069 RepID=A0A1J1I0L4_9DIPT|nr:CLUMA_CG007414, isoform A [Clunio marinus]